MIIKNINKIINKDSDVVKIKSGTLSMELQQNGFALLSYDNDYYYFRKTEKLINYLHKKGGNRE